MKANSMDLRKRVLAMCDADRTTCEVAGVFDVSEPWVQRLKQWRREEGIIGPRPSGGRRHGHFDPVRLQQLRGWLRQHPDATLEWLLGRVEREMGLRCRVMAVCRAVKKLGWSLKKNASSRRTRSPGRSPPTHELRHCASLR
ncbi:MAG: transposase [Planctomycetes bacterium]|nr:transposase [Planctomycetota bacterium]